MINQPLLLSLPGHAFQWRRATAVILLLFGCGFPVQTWGQSEASDPYDEIIQSIRSAEYNPAERKIDELLAKDLDDHKAHMLRKALANALVRVNKRDRAELQFEKFLDYLLSGREQSRPLLRQIPQLLVNIRFLRENEEPKASRTLDKIVATMKQAVQEAPNNVGYSTGLSTAINFKARGLQKQGNYEAVQQVYSAELDRLRELWRQSNESPNNWLRLVYFLKTAASPKNPDYQLYATHLLLEKKNLLELAIEKFPQSADVVNQYTSDTLLEIQALQGQSPRAALPLLLKLQNRVDTIIDGWSTPEVLLGSKLSVGKAVQKLQRQFSRESLVDSPLPQLEQMHWLRGESKDVSFPQTSPVAIVFANPAEQQNIESIHQLQQALGKRDVACKLVVIFNDYQQSFLRLASVKKKQNAGFEKNRKLFRDNLNENVLKEDAWPGPVGLATDSGSLANRFGIDKLPYVVMLDRAGVCRSMSSGPTDIEKFVESIKRISDQ